MVMKKLFVTGLLLMSSTALADEHVIVLKQQTIASHPGRPLAATEVSKLPVRVTTALATPTFTGRIQAPTSVAPF